MKQIYHISIALILSATPIVLSAQTGGYRSSSYYHQKESLFKSLPISRGATIFLGNSITDGAEWSELFPGKLILNRGISGDVTQGVLHRLDEVVRHEPSKIFLLIGINDLAQGRSANQVCQGIFQIVKDIQRQSPHTLIYVQSILPINNSYDKFKSIRDKGEHIVLINKVLKNNATKHRYTYIDLYTQMADGSGQLREEFTNDGLHLTGSAYVHWSKIIKKYLVVP